LEKELSPKQKEVLSYKARLNRKTKAIMALMEERNLDDYDVSERIQVNIKIATCTDRPKRIVWLQLIIEKSWQFAS
jgi:hypothetical protein